MLWNVDAKGFLPTPDPLLTLPIHNYNDTQLIYVLENLAHNIPAFQKERRGREEIVSQLREISACFGHGTVDSLGTEAEYERVFFILNFFASAFVHAWKENTHDRVPKEITVPLARAAHLVRRQPLLDYTSYVLYNYRRGSTDPVNTFTDSDEEKTVIKSFLEAERMTAELFGLANTLQLLEAGQTILSRIAELMDHVAGLEKSHFVNYYRPFVNVYYEGWLQTTKTYDTNLFFQAPFIAFFKQSLGIGFQHALMQTYEHEIMLYRPMDHQNFLGVIHSVREPAKNDCPSVYNKCLEYLARIYAVVDSLGAPEIGQVRQDELATYRL